MLQIHSNDPVLDVLQEFSSPHFFGDRTNACCSFSRLPNMPDGVATCFHEVLHHAPPQPHPPPHPAPPWTHAGMLDSPNNPATLLDPAWLLALRHAPRARLLQWWCMFPLHYQLWLATPPKEEERTCASRLQFLFWDSTSTPPNAYVEALGRAVQGHGINGIKLVRDHHLQPASLVGPGRPKGASDW